MISNKYLPLILLRIFSSTELDLVSLAKGFALPHLPKMPELKGKDVSSFTPDLCPSVDIPYKNKSREKQRRENNEKRKAGEFFSSFNMHRIKGKGRWDYISEIKALCIHSIAHFKDISEIKA